MVFPYGFGQVGIGQTNVYKDGVYRWACLPEAARALRMGEIFEVSGFRNTPRNCPISAQSGKLHLAKVWVAEAVRLLDNTEVVAPARNLQGQWQAPDPTNKRHTAQFPALGSA